MSFKFYATGPGRQAVSQAFLRGWFRCADRFLAAGFCDPERFFVVLGQLGIYGDSMPDEFRASLLGVIGGCGRLEYECDEELLAWGLARDGIEGSMNDVQHTIYSWGAADGVEEFGKQVSEHAVRCKMFGQMDLLLSDDRPLSETATALLECVA